MNQTRDLTVHPSECDTTAVNPFRFGALREGFLLTTDHGKWQWMTAANFKLFLAGKIDEGTPLYEELSSKGLLRANTDVEVIAQAVRKRKNHLGIGPVLHQVQLNDKQGWLTIETVKAIIDHAMQSTAAGLHFELIHHGGKIDEGVIEFIINYCIEKNKYEHKELVWTLSAPLDQLSPESANVLARYHCSLHTTMYGPKELQRSLSAVPLSTLQHNIETFRSARQEAELHGVQVTMPVGKTLSTDPALALDTLIEVMGQDITVFFEPITNGKEAIAIAEFKDFYHAALALLAERPELENVREGHTLALLASILRSDLSANPTHHSPGCAGLSVHGYDKDGNIYPNHLASKQQNKDLLRIGTAGQSSYEETLSNPNLKAITIASVLDCLPGFNLHWATPFLAIDPVACYAETGDLFEPFVVSRQVKIGLARLETVFEILIDDSSCSEHIKSWK